MCFSNVQRVVWENSSLLPCPFDQQFSSKLWKNENKWNVVLHDLPWLPFGKVKMARKKTLAYWTVFAASSIVEIQEEEAGTFLPSLRLIDIRQWSQAKLISLSMWTKLWLCQSDWNIYWGSAYLKLAFCIHYLTAADYYFLRALLYGCWDRWWVSNY